MQGVRGGDVGGIIGGEQDYTAWDSGRGDMYLENLGHRGRVAEVPHSLTVQRRPADLPGGGMTTTSGDEDGDAGTFYAPSFPVHHGHFG